MLTSSKRIDRSKERYSQGMCGKLVAKCIVNIKNRSGVDLIYAENLVCNIVELQCTKKKANKKNRSSNVSDDDDVPARGDFITEDTHIRLP